MTRWLPDAHTISLSEHVPTATIDGPVLDDLI
jgi:hypothetical protein